MLIQQGAAATLIGHEDWKQIEPIMEYVCTYRLCLYTQTIAKGCLFSCTEYNLSYRVYNRDYVGLGIPSRQESRLCKISTCQWHRCGIDVACCVGKTGATGVGPTVLDAQAGAAQRYFRRYLRRYVHTYVPCSTTQLGNYSNSTSQSRSTFAARYNLCITPYSTSQPLYGDVSTGT